MAGVGVWTGHRGRMCHVCGCSMAKAKDSLGVGVMRPWRGFRPVGSEARAGRSWICEGCLRGAARWLSTLPDHVALSMMHEARKGRGQ